MSNIEIDNGAERSDSADSIITTEEVSNESTIILGINVSDFVKRRNNEV